MSLLFGAAGWVARAVYAVMKAFTRPAHKVVFLSRQSDEPSLDFRLLADALHAGDPDLEIVMMCRRLGSGLGRLAAMPAMLAQMGHLATARVCIVDGYVIPVSLLDHRPELRVVQLWHALGAIKQFGYQTLDRPDGHPSWLARTLRMHRNYDLVCCSGPATVAPYAAAFGCDPSIVRIVGLPRVDYLLAQGRVRGDSVGRGTSSPGARALVAANPQLADEARTIVLYAPTMRPGGADRFDDVIARFSDPSFVVVVRPHPLEQVTAEGANVIDASGVEVLDLLSCCDVVITDYSAVAIEASVLKVPVLFWAYDFEEYRRARGLNIDLLADYPSIASTSLETIAACVEARDWAPESQDRFAHDYMSVADGRCTERIVDYVCGAVAADDPKRR